MSKSSRTWGSPRSQRNRASTSEGVFHWIRSTASNLDINRVLLLHSFVAIWVGGLAFVMPHSLVEVLFQTKYDHFVHELARMMHSFGDGRIRRCISEAFSIAYGLQAAALLRAQLSEPRSHALFNTIGWVVFAGLSAFYGYCRWFKTIKVFELPGTLSETSE